MQRGEEADEHDVTEATSPQSAADVAAQTGVAPEAKKKSSQEKPTQAQCV